VKDTKVKLARLKPTVADSYDDEAPLAAAPSWDGTPTAIKLARPVMRDHRIVGPGMPCIDCGESGDHHFHLRAALGKDGVWLGPEAGHATDLIAQGLVSGTPEKQARDNRQAMVDVERGLFAPEERDAEGNLVRRPFPELAEQTMADVQRTWDKVLEGGPEKVIERELGERREAVGDLARIGSTLGKAIREALLEQPNQAPAPESGH